MIEVRNGDRQKVVEDSRGLWKADAVPTLVGNRLVRIPYKAQGHGLSATHRMRFQRVFPARSTTTKCRIVVILAKDASAGQCPLFQTPRYGLAACARDGGRATIRLPGDARHDRVFGERIGDGGE